MYIICIYKFQISCSGKLTEKIPCSPMSDFSSELLGWPNRILACERYVNLRSRARIELQQNENR